MKPFPQYPEPKSWVEWRQEMLACTWRSKAYVVTGDAERAGIWARAAAHAAFYS